MFFSIFFYFASSKKGDEWPGTQTWSGFTPTQSWPPTKIPPQTWPTSTPNWLPTRSKPPTAPSGGGGSSLSTGAIVGIAVGSAALVALICVAIIFRAKFPCYPKETKPKIGSANLNDDLLTEKTDQ